MTDPCCFKCGLSRSMYQMLMAACFKDMTPLPLCVEKKMHEFDKPETEH